MFEGKIICVGVDGAPTRQLADLLNSHTGFHKGQKMSEYDHVVWNLESEGWESNFKEKIGASLDGEAKAFVFGPDQSTINISAADFASAVNESGATHVVAFHFNPEDSEIWERSGFGADEIDHSNNWNTGIEEAVEERMREGEFFVEFHQFDGSALFQKSDDEYEKMVAALGLEHNDAWNEKIDELRSDFF